MPPHLQIEIAVAWQHAGTPAGPPSLPPSAPARPGTAPRGAPRGPRLASVGAIGCYAGPGAARGRCSGPHARAPQARSSRSRPVRARARRHRHVSRHERDESAAASATVDGAAARRSDPQHPPLRGQVGVPRPHIRAPIRTRPGISGTIVAIVAPLDATRKSRHALPHPRTQPHRELGDDAPAAVVAEAGTGRLARGGVRRDLGEYHLGDGRGHDEHNIPASCGIRCCRRGGPGCSCPRPRESRAALDDEAAAGDRALETCRPHERRERVIELGPEERLDAVEGQRARPGWSCGWGTLRLTRSARRERGGTAALVTQASTSIIRAPGRGR